MKTIFFSKTKKWKKRKFQIIHFSSKTLRKKRHFSTKIDLIKFKKKINLKYKNLHKKLQKLKSGKIK